jgi:hypothetical protein
LIPRTTAPMSPTARQRLRKPRNQLSVRRHTQL